MIQKLPTALVGALDALCDRMIASADTIETAIDRNEENTLSDPDAREWIVCEIAKIRAALEEVEARI
jgi:hypothetical protein